VRFQFDALAPSWQSRRAHGSLDSLDAALDRVAIRPRRVLDLGTGTGIGARYLAERYPEAEIAAVDLSSAMIEEARRLTDDERIEYAVADASSLPYENGRFDLVVLVNMIPFFDELARITATGGAVVAAFSSGPATPIYVPPDVLRRELESRGFTHFEHTASGPSTALLATRT
jgi:ubiquinone/menaquinone biosynthesis C-methylase UbiE